MHTIVFLGPSLPLAEAKSLLPDAVFHPPIKCGDMVHMLRLKPKRLVIIDGLYENIPAVWHKEILFAIEQGVEVVGAGSMGALRAAEMSYYGMKGVGQIYQWFESGYLEDDDEVAVLHHGHEQQFKPINDAMVNIRASLIESCKQGIIDEATKNQLITCAKETFYPNRQLKKIVQKVASEKGQDLSSLIAWLDDNYIDLKRLDAKAVLDWARETPIEAPACREKTEQTRFFRLLLMSSSLNPIAHQLEWLPLDEKKKQALHRGSPEPYSNDLCHEVAYALMMLDKFGTEQKRMHDLDALDDYIKEHQLVNVSHYFNKDMPERLKATRQWLTERVCYINLKASTVEKYLNIAKLIYVDFLHQFDTRDDEFLKFKVISLFCLNSLLEERGLLLDSQAFITYLQNFRQELSIEEGKPAFFQWLKDNDIDFEQFSYFTLIYARYRYAFKGFQGSFLMNDQKMCLDNHSWLSTSMELKATMS